MIGQYLPNNNEKDTVPILQKNLHLNPPLVSFREENSCRSPHTNPFNLRIHAPNGGPIAIIALLTTTVYLLDRPSSPGSAA
jgi:hypothetical protein